MVASTAPCSSSTPGTSDRNASSSAPSAIATAAATSSALTLRRRGEVPSRPIGAIRGTRSAPHAACSGSRAIAIGSPTSPSSPRRRHSMSSPVRNGCASRPSARSSPTSASETSASATRAQASVGRSVKRRPSTQREVIPRRSISAVICAPPPCTSTSGRPSAAAIASGSRARALPPSLATKAPVMSCTPRSAPRRAWIGQRPRSRPHRHRAQGRWRSPPSAGPQPHQPPPGP